MKVKEGAMQPSCRRAFQGVCGEHVWGGGVCLPRMLKISEKAIAVRGEKVRRSLHKEQILWGHGNSWKELAEMNEEFCIESKAI